jgi:hypothetical protein
MYRSLHICDIALVRRARPTDAYDVVGYRGPGRDCSIQCQTKAKDDSGKPTHSRRYLARQDGPPPTDFCFIL